MGGLCAGWCTWQRLFSQKRGLGSWSVPCSGSTLLQPGGPRPSHTRQEGLRAGRGGELRRASEGEVMEGRGPSRHSLAEGLGRGVGRGPAYHGCNVLGPGRSEGGGPGDLLLAGPVGCVWGPGPAPSLRSLCPPRRRPVSNSSPGVTRSRGGVGPRAPPPRPTLQAHLAAEPASIQCPPGPAGSPEVGWGGGAGQGPREAEWRPGRARRSEESGR